MRNHAIQFFLFSIILIGGSLKAQTVVMRIPDTTVMSGNTIDIPIYADNTLTGKNVLAYTLQYTFNQAYFQVLSVITTGTLSAPFGSPAVNTSVPGKITIAGAGTSALTGQGRFIYVRFKALQPGGSGLNFTGTLNNYFNEGTPAMVLDDGYVTISTPPAITISPNTGIITKGEQLQFNQSGGTAPFQWFVTNPAVATINATGMLTGTQAGFTKVVVQDINGLRDTTNSAIDIRAMRLSIPTNLTQWQGADIDVPVNTTTLTGLNIYSGNLVINFNSNILSPVGIVQAGTLLSSFPSPTVNINLAGVISIAFAGTTALSGSGSLIYVRFHVSTQNTGGSAINFVSAIFDETYVPMFTNGYFTTINLPVLSIAPNTGTLVAGQVQQFTVNGGATLPVTWSVNNPAIASISPGGLVNTIKGGNLVVSVVDAHGATASSGNWLVYDTRVIMPDTTVCPAALTFYYPVFIRALPAGESVNSVQAVFTFNQTLLTFQLVEASGTLTQGWTYVSNPATGIVSIAGSGTTSFNTTGIIFYLKFGLNPAFVAGSQASVQLPSILLNEGIPNPLVDVNGSITGYNPALASVSIVANPSGAVCSGTSVVFTATPVNGAVPTYQWKKNNINIPGQINQTYTSNSLVSGDIITCVLTPTGPCATGPPANSNAITMTVNSLPLAASSIAGPVTVTSGQTVIGYSIPTVTYATTYTWVVPAGWTITNGQGTNSILVTAGGVGGAILVTPANSCGNGTSLVLNVNITGTKTLNLTLMLEGLFNGVTMNQAQDVDGSLNQFNNFPGTTVDTLSVYLASGTLPFGFLYGAHSLNISPSGAVSVVVPGGLSGSYYIAVFHRSNIQTWSGSPVSFAGSSTSYNFTTSASQAFGSNQKDLLGNGTKWGFYSGDVTSGSGEQDGYVDFFDLNDIFNLNIASAYGYQSSDLTGDGFVDFFDLNLVYNNNINSVGMNTPPNPAKGPGIRKSLSGREN